MKYLIAVAVLLLVGGAAYAKFPHGGGPVAVAPPPCANGQLDFSCNTVLYMVRL